MLFRVRMPISDKMQSLLETVLDVGDTLIMFKSYRISTAAILGIRPTNVCYPDEAVIRSNRRCKKQPTGFAMPEARLSVTRPVRAACFVYQDADRMIRTFKLQR